MSWVIVAVSMIAVSGAVTAYGQYAQGKATAKMYQYQQYLSQQQAAITRKYAEEQKKSLEETAVANITGVQGAAAEESKSLFRQVAKIAGQQRATVGTLGIGGVTAADIAADTFDKSKMDEIAIRFNADMRSWEIKDRAKKGIWALGEETKFKAWSLESEAVGYGVAAKNARKAANINTAGTLLATAGSMAGMGALKVTS